MADENKLSSKPQLDTTDFKTGIATMNRELRVLESGFRASTAALGDYADSANGLELRIKSLNSQMDIQKQKVAATRAEYERIKQEKGENSKAAQDLEIKLNKEVEALGKMENELGETEAALEEMSSGTDEAGESVDELGDQAEESGEQLVTFQDITEATGTIAKGLTTLVLGLVAGLIAVGVAIGGMVFNAADAAGQLVDLSTKTGISTTRLQELSYVGDQVGTSLDTITGAQTRLVRSMAGAQEQTDKFNESLAEGKDPDDLQLGDLAQAFDTLGVSVTDANGGLRDQQEVFEDVIDALGRIENPAERDALAMELFGKSAQELNPLIKAGSAELARLADEAHNVGAVMDEEAVAGLEGFGDTIASIQAGLKGTLGTLAAEFLPAFQEVATALQDLFKSEQFKQALREFGELIKGSITVVVEALQRLLSGDFEGALAAIFGGDAAATIVRIFGVINEFIQNTLIPFVTTHAEAIKAALIGIGAVLGGAAIVGAIAAVVAAINPVTLIIAAIAAAVGLLAAAWEGNWLGMRDIINLWWSNMLLVLEPLWTWLSTTIPAALQTLSDVWTNVLLPAIQVVWSFLNDSVFPLFQAIAEFINAVFSLALRVLAGIWEGLLLPALQVVWGFLSNNILPIFQEVSEFIQKHVQPIFEEFGEFLDGSLVPAFQGISNAISGVIDWLHQMAEMLNNVELPDWMTPGSPTPWELGLIGINKAMRDLNLQLPILAQQLNQSLPSAAAVPGLGRQAGSSSVQNDQFQFFAPVVIQGDTPSGSLGSKLKGRRY